MFNPLRGEAHPGAGGEAPLQLEHAPHLLLAVAVGGVLLPPRAATELAGPKTMEMERETEVWQFEVGAGGENGRPSPVR